MVPAAVIKLNETDAALDQSPRQQAIGRERARPRTSGPYRSKVAPIRWPDRSIQGPKFACDRPSRTAQCEWRSRDRPWRPVVAGSIAPGRSSICRRRVRSIPAGFGKIEHGIGTAAQLDPLMAGGQKTAPHSRSSSPWLLSVARPCEIMTTNVGRSGFRSPSRTTARPPATVGRAAASRSE